MPKFGHGSLPPFVHARSACAEINCTTRRSGTPRNLVSTQVSARDFAAKADEADHRAFDEAVQRAFRKGDGAITIFSEDDGGDIEQPDDDGGAGDAPAAAPIDMAAINAAVGPAGMVKSILIPSSVALNCSKMVQILVK